MNGTGDYNGDTVGHDTIRRRNHKPKNPKVLRTRRAEKVNRHTSIG